MSASKKQKLAKAQAKPKNASEEPVAEKARKVSAIEEKRQIETAPESDPENDASSMVYSDSDLEGDAAVQNEQSGDESSGTLDSNTGENSDDSFPMKKQKKATEDGAEPFAKAFSAIIGSKLKAYDRKDPILARNKTTQKKLESDKLEAKARHLLRVEKREERNRHRVKQLLPQDPAMMREAFESERRMKKMAQRGVVKLFNAILATQVSISSEVSAREAYKHPESMTELTKLKFLDMVKAAGQE